MNRAQLTAMQASATKTYEEAMKCTEAAKRTERAELITANIVAAFVMGAIADMLDAAIEVTPE